MTPSETSTETTQEGENTWSTPGVRGIGLASFLADVGHEVPTSLFPSLLVGTLGASAALLGIIEGIADGAAGLARLAGALSPTIQRGGVLLLLVGTRVQRCSLHSLA